MSSDNSDRTVTDYKERCHLYDYSLQTTEKIKNGSQRNIIFEVFFLLLKNYSIMAKIQLIYPFLITYMKVRYFNNKDARDSCEIRYLSFQTSVNPN